MFWNKEYTTKGDKILDNETGDELDINTNKLADKSGIKADLGQGESPFEVEVTPKKDVKEKFAKAFKKALMVGTVTLFTAGLIYGGAQVKDVYDDYSQYYKEYSAGPKEMSISEDYAKFAFNNYGSGYFTFDNGVLNLNPFNNLTTRGDVMEFLVYDAIIAERYQKKLEENNLQFDYTKINDVRNIQNSESFAEMPDGRENIIRDMEKLYIVLYKYENLKKQIFKDYDKEFKDAKDGMQVGEYYMDKIYNICEDHNYDIKGPDIIYQLNPLEVKQAQIRIDKIKLELSDVIDKINLYEKDNGAGLEYKLEYEIRKCDELFEEAVNEVEKEYEVKIHCRHGRVETLQEYQQNMEKLDEIKKNENIKNVEYCGDGEFFVEFNDIETEKEDIER